MRKDSNLTEIVIYISTNWKIYFSAVAQVLLINAGFEKNACAICVFCFLRTEGVCHVSFIL